MFSEYRVGGTTPESWSDNFRAQLHAGDGRLNALRMRFDPRWREIRARVPAGGRVLDAGSGTGTWVRFLRDHGYRAVGLDYSRELIDHLRARDAGIEWVHGPIQAIPLPDASVDAIISWGVIEHDLAGPEAALREFLRVLKPGGWAFLTVPLDTVQHRRASERLFGRRREGREFFQYYFTESEFEERVRGAGFEVERVFPASRHYALAVPRLYERLVRAPRLAQRVIAPALDLYGELRDDTWSMVMAVAQRPPL